jgi:uncharacterized protein involved in response to NO
MRNSAFAATPPVRRAVPRGIAQSGPAILAYGFRPFFLLAGVIACLDMILWIGALTGLWTVGGPEGPIGWHGHEMLFGYATAALCGFILTAVPNWTGRLPVSGAALLALVLLWLAGRILLVLPVTAGSPLGAIADSLFLPVLAFVIAREVVAGRNWQNLRIAGVIAALAGLNIGFHIGVAAGWDITVLLRGGVALFVLLVCIVGGRIIPSFTRNYLAKRAGERLPRPMGTTDHVAIVAALAAGIAWAMAPEGAATSALCLGAGVANAVRLGRWRGARTAGEPLLLVLHVAYGFIPLGFLVVAAAAMGVLSQASALHVLTVGVIGLTTLAVMTRATRGHTGRPLTASRATTAAYCCLFGAAVLRPFAELVPDLYQPLLGVSGTLWIAAFALYVAEHAPMQLTRSAGAPRAPTSGRSARDARG